MPGLTVILYGEGGKEGPSGDSGKGWRSDFVGGKAKTTCTGEGFRFHSKVISPHSSSHSLN